MELIKIDNRRRFGETIWTNCEYIFGDIYLTHFRTGVIAGNGTQRLVDISFFCFDTCLRSSLKFFSAARFLWKNTHTLTMIDTFCVWMFEIFHSSLQIVNVFAHTVITSVSFSKFCLAWQILCRNSEIVLIIRSALICR